MSKTRNNHLVQQKYHDDEDFTVYDYPFADTDTDIDYFDYDRFEESDCDCKVSVAQTNTEQKQVVPPKKWDGIMRKEPQITTKKYDRIPSLVTLCVDTLPMSVRAELPPYFPGSLEYLKDW